MRVRRIEGVYWDTQSKQHQQEKKQEKEKKEKKDTFQDLLEEEKDKLKKGIDIQA